MTDGGRPGDDTPADRSSPPPDAFRPVRAVARLLLVAYPVLLAVLVLRPSGAGWTYPANLTPLASVDRALALGGSAGARQLASGLLPLAPFGVLLPLAVGRLGTAWLPSFLRTAGGTALLATGLEILKSWAPGHVLNVDDIILGTLGAAVCHLAVVPAARSLLRLRGRSPHGTAADRRQSAGQAPRTAPLGRFGLPDTAPRR
ncbi:hypothetical protein KNE206_23330 [Kitasatospora sp. NE20-6]|uniref:VanZ family protein n=1 Tax=Kitasatospora sp. NE20-6 TaxID=2859066 RepID=UPI0034DC0E39